MGKDVSIEEQREKIQLLYDANNIIREKSELYYDFIVSLLTIIDETYLGRDLISTQDDITNHFMWCFNKVLKNFEYERIKFTPISNTTYDYLWYFIYTKYYSPVSKIDDKYNVLVDYFTFLFDYTAIKSTLEINSYINFYKMFDQNLKKLN